MPFPKRRTVRPVGAAALIVLAAIAVGCTSHLYVDAGAQPGGDGSKAKPFKTIREGVNAARARTTIHIAKGMYVEELKTIIERPCLKLKGSTVLTLDGQGLPTDVVKNAAIVKPQTPIPSGVALFQIQARNVQIKGLEIDGTSGSSIPSGVLINVDGATTPADGFSIEKNVLVNAGVGVAARMAAGKIRGNYIAKQRSQGVMAFGWPAEASSRRRKVLFEKNRVSGNYLNGALFFGGVGSARQPSFPERHGTLRVEISENEFECNGSQPALCPSRNPNTGVYFILNDSTASDPTKHARIDALVRGNTFTNNIWYGIVVGQRIEPNRDPIGYEFEGTFLRNKYSGNGLNAAAFTFQHIVTTQGSTMPPFRFGHDSTYTINAVHDPLAGIDFDYDNPANDSTGTPLKNKLIVNGNSYDGQRIKHCPPPAGSCLAKP